MKNFATEHHEKKLRVGVARARELGSCIEVSLKDQLGAHWVYCEEARALYEDSLIAADRALDWREALTESRKLIVKSLRDSDCLRDIPAALEMAGSHMRVFRHLMAPPTSQDQFKLICRPWSKGSEKEGKTVKPAGAVMVAKSFNGWRWARITPWLNAGRDPTMREIGALLHAVSPLMADKAVATARRNRLAAKQERDLMACLDLRGWLKLPPRNVDLQAPLKPNEYMHRARFASGETGYKEVDIALGLPKAAVLALECKVTNDSTNSVKRIDDVLKKASGWKDHWGNWVRPAALLQGVIKPADVKRLLDQKVEVFWSHRLNLFNEWLDKLG